MKNLALQRIKEINPYNPPLSGRSKFSGLLLDFNERTLPPSSKVQKATRDFLKSNRLQLYPEYGSLEQKLAQYAGVSANQIMITNGSDQAIDLIFRTFTDVGNSVIIPSPSFAMFYQSAKIAGNKILSPLYSKENLEFPLKQILRMINGSVNPAPITSRSERVDRRFNPDEIGANKRNIGCGVKLIVICNPNNPTGTLISINDIKKIALKASNAIILVDEAYFEFSRVTAVTLINKYPNVIVTRTLSKAFGLSSLRIGYVVASKICINELLKVRGPYDVNMIAYIASLAALNDQECMQKYVDEVMDNAKSMVEEFFKMNNIPFYKSFANFILFKPANKKAEKILKENGILVRPQNKINIKNTLRLTIGTVDQMKRFIKIYRNVILDKSKPKKYAFLDRDGTLIFEPQDTFQIDSIEKLEILKGTIKGLKGLRKLGYELIMITNQDGLGTSSFPQANFEAVQNKMLSIFEKNNIKFKKIFICGHPPSENCSCRKPKIGLVKNFFRENQVDKNNSFMCGDRATDKQFSETIGIKFIPIQTNGNFYNALKKGTIL